MLLATGGVSAGARTIALQLTAVNASSGNPAGVLASASFAVDLPAYGSPTYTTLALDPGLWRLEPSTPYALLVDNPSTDRSQQIFWYGTGPLSNGIGSVFNVLPGAFQGFNVTGTKLSSDGTNWISWGAYTSILVEATAAPRCAPTPAATTAGSVPGLGSGHMLWTAGVLAACSCCDSC